MKNILTKTYISFLETSNLYDDSISESRGAISLFDLEDTNKKKTNISDVAIYIWASIKRLHRIELYAFCFSSENKKNMK